VPWFVGQNADRHYFLLAVVVYGLSMIHSFFLWRRGFRRDDHISYFLLLAGFGFHTTAMLFRGLRLNHCPVGNLYEATTFITWTIVGVCLLAGLWPRLRFVGAFASPGLLAIGIFALMPSLDPDHTLAKQIPGTSVVWTSIHAALLALAYGAFGLSSVAALMYLTQERDLKLHRLKAVFARLPAIQRLETLIGVLLLTGFILLTTGLVIGGFVLGHLKNPEVYRGDPKILWSALVWVIYLGLLLMRWKFARGGRRIALGALGGFVFVLLTFWGTNVLSSLHNP
jgi:HemX protein